VKLIGGQKQPPSTNPPNENENNTETRDPGQTIPGPQNTNMQKGNENVSGAGVAGNKNQWAHDFAEEWAKEHGFGSGESTERPKAKPKPAPSEQSDSKKPRWTTARLWIPGDPHEAITAFDVEPSLKASGTGPLSEQFWSRLYAAQNYVIYESVECEFYRYNPGNGAWIVTEPELVRREIIEGIETAANLWRMPKLKNQCTERTLKGVMSLLKGHIHAKDFFANRPRYVIHAANCMIVFDKDGSYHKEAFAHTFRSRNASPIPFKEDAECQRFEEAMLGHLEKDTKDLLQQYAGQILLGYNYSQTILILRGEPDSGKTEFLRLSEEMIGSQNVCELRTEHLGQRFETGRFVGKTLLTGADVPHDFLSNKSAHALKGLVGGDHLTGEGKNSNKNLDMYGTFNVAASANCELLVKIHKDQDAWRKRLRIADFTEKFQGGKVDDIHKVLVAAEGSGILNWMLKGAQKLISQDGQITLSNRQQNLVDDLLMQSDALGIFIRSEIVKTNNGDDDLTVDEIYTEFAQYCLGREWECPSKEQAQREISTLMSKVWSIPKSHDIERPKVKSARGFHYVRFRTSSDFDPDPGS
jgi:hypothetical protein